MTCTVTGLLSVWFVDCGVEAAGISRASSRTGRSVDGAVGHRIAIVIIIITLNLRKEGDAANG